jgi:hypothetical protein
VAAYSVPIVPTVEARIIGKKKELGRTVPIEMVCSDRAGQSERYIVKFYSDVNLGHEGLAREVIGALLGQYFVLPIPLIAIVDIPAKLVTSTQDTRVVEKLLRSPGYNFGSKMVETEFVPFRVLKETDRQTATEIFAFDMLIHNVDRRIDKLNVFQTSDGLVILDHEMAFSYAHPDTYLGGLPEPWEIARALPNYKTHPFYGHLKGNHLPFDSFERRLREIDNDLLDQIEAQVPVGWRSDALGFIRAYLTRASDGADRFVRSLKEVLSV